MDQIMSSLWLTTTAKATVLSSEAPSPSSDCSTREVSDSDWQRADAAGPRTPARPEPRMISQAEAEGSPGPSPASQLTQLQGTELRRVKVALWPGPTPACRSSGGPAARPVCHGDEETESLHGLQLTHGALQLEPLGRGSLAPTRPSRPSQAQPLNRNI